MSQLARILDIVRTVCCNFVVINRAECTPIKRVQKLDPTALLSVTVTLACKQNDTYLLTTRIVTLSIRGRRDDPLEKFAQRAYNVGGWQPMRKEEPHLPIDVLANHRSNERENLHYSIGTM